MQKAIFVCETTAIDPHTNGPVEVAIYDVFYYGMGLEEARLSIGKVSAANDFVITRVQSLNFDVIQSNEDNIK